MAAEDAPPAAWEEATEESGIVVFVVVAVVEVSVDSR
jgi:hypothetical protein